MLVYNHTVFNKKLWSNSYNGIVSNSIGDEACSSAQTQSGYSGTGVMWMAVLAALFPQLSTQYYSVHTIICK